MRTNKNFEQEIMSKTLPKSFLRRYLYELYYKRGFSEQFSQLCDTLAFAQKTPKNAAFIGLPIFKKLFSIKRLSGAEFKLKKKESVQTAKDYQERKWQHKARKRIRFSKTDDPPK